MITRLRDEIGDLPEPEHRNGDTHQPYGHQRPVDPCAAKRRRDRAHDNGHHHPDHSATRRQRQRDGRGLDQFRHDLFATIGVGGQILRDEELLHHRRILDGQGTVEPVFLPHLGDGLRGGVLARDT